MIVKTDKEALLSCAAPSITAEIKLRSDLASHYYKTDSGYIMQSGDSALLFGIKEISEELSSFFAFSGIKKIMGGEYPLSFTEYAVMAADGKGGKTANTREIKPAAEMICRVFSLPFSEVYSSLCEKVNCSAAEVCYTGFSASVLLKSSVGCLLTSVCSEKKGYGHLAVADALSRTSGKVYLLCDKSIIPFYEKSGFRVIGYEKEYIL